MKEWDTYSKFQFSEDIQARVRNTMGRLLVDPTEAHAGTRQAVDELLSDERHYVCFLQHMGNWSSEEYLHLYDRFVAAGFSVDREVFYGCPALHGAIFSLNIPLVRRVLQAGAFLGQYKGCPHNGWHAEPDWTTPLHRAVSCVRGRYEKLDWGWRAPDDGSLTRLEENLCLNIITMLLDAGADPNETDDDSDTPLLELLRWLGRDWVKEHGDFLYRVARLLIDRGANRACMHRNGYYPLTSVWLEDNAELFDLLYGDDPETRARTLPSDFLARCDYFPRPAFLKRMLSLGVSLNGRSAYNGHTPLTKLVSVLRDRSLYLRSIAWEYRNYHRDGAKTPRALGQHGWLEWVFSLNRDSREEFEELLPSLRVLLEAGADIDVIDADGYTLAEAALRVNDARVAETLREFGLRLPTTVYNGKPALVFHIIATKGGAECLDLLLEAGCGIEDGDDNNFTPLHMAAQYGNPHSIRRLVERGADVHAKSIKGGAVPLHMLMTAFKDPPPLAVMAVEALLDHGADPNAVDKGDFTPLHYLALCRTKLITHGDGDEPQRTVEDVTFPCVAPFRREAMADAARLLVERGADITRLTDEGKPPLAFAPLTGNPELFDILLGDEEERRITCPGDFLVRCELYSAFPGKDVLARLMKLGCDVNARGKNGVTPLMRAVASYSYQEVEELGFFSWSRQQHLETARTLLQAGADPNAVNDDGFPAVNYAREEDLDTVYALLLRYGYTGHKPAYAKPGAEEKPLGLFTRIALRLFVFVGESIVNLLRRK